jgi:hypothetical protein
MGLNNGFEAPDLEGSLITSHMHGPNLGPIDDEIQAKQHYYEMRLSSLWVLLDFE